MRGGIANLTVAPQVLKDSMLDFLLLDISIVIEGRGGGVGS